MIKNCLAAFVVLVLLIFTTGCAKKTPLNMAIEKNDIKAIHALLDQGADINEESSCGTTMSSTITATPLKCAVWFNNPEIIKLLLDKGANIDESYGSTPLSLATAYGLTKSAKVLIERGANPNISGSLGNWMPLSSAAYSNHIDIMKLLIANGADIDVAIESLKQGYDSWLPDRNKKIDSGIALLEKLKVKQEAATRVETPKSKIMPDAAPAPAAVIITSDVDEVPFIQVKPNKQAYAIVIGIEQYRQKLPKATFAAQDARLMARYLNKVFGYPEENIITLINEHASRNDFEKYIGKWLANNLEDGGTVFIYYSGHGAPNPETGDAYMVPYDGDPTFIEDTGYSLKRLYENLRKLPAGKVIVVLDSCFSGVGQKSVLAKGARPVQLAINPTALVSQNMAVLSASAGNQTSSTYEEKGHGLFTYFLLRGIKDSIETGKDWKIDIGELYDYLKPRVERTARKYYNAEQTPQLIAPANKNFLMD